MRFLFFCLLIFNLIYLNLIFFILLIEKTFIFDKLFSILKLLQDFISRFRIIKFFHFKLTIL